MIRIRQGIVDEIRYEDNAVAELSVTCEGVRVRAVAYPRLTGPVSPGDRVLLNTTATALGLGSGGIHFVMAGLDRLDRDLPQSPGHIMKLNYTPMQGRVLSVEEPDSPHHEAIRDFDTLGGMPVIAGSLHSMLAPVCAAVHELSQGRVRVVYMMTDAACLPMGFSRTVRDLRKKALLHGTVTCGQAFGGDAQAVNKFTGLMAARVALDADLVVAAMGVGSVGTGTPMGHGAMEQGEILNAAGALGGRPVALPRISFADKRPRHQGISHHTLSALGTAAHVSAILPLPVMESEWAAHVRAQLEDSGLMKRFDVREYDGAVATGALDKHGLRITTMGRGPEADPEFFLACGAAARAAIDLLPDGSHSH